MYLREIADAVGDKANDTCLKAAGTLYSRAKQFINEAYILDILSLRNDWWFLKRQGTIQTPAEETTGTLTVTNGSTSVTGSGTSFGSDDVGKMLVVGARAQRIGSVGGATSLTLENAWENETKSSANYKIVKDRYDLPKWLQIKNLREIKEIDQKPLTGVDELEFDRITGNKAATGTPKYFMPLDRVRNNYTTGTLSGTVSTKVLTGSGTSWDTSDIEQHDVIQVGSYAYTVDSVDSATQITVFEDLAETVSGSSYTAIMDRYRIQLYPFPFELKTLKLTGSQTPTPLNDDSDIPLIPIEWHYLIVKGAYIKALKHNQDPGVQVELAEYTELLRRLVRENARDDYRTDTWWQVC